MRGARCTGGARGARAGAGGRGTKGGLRVKGGAREVAVETARARSGRARARGGRAWCVRASGAERERRRGSTLARGCGRSGWHVGD